MSLRQTRCCCSARQSVSSKTIICHYFTDYCRRTSRWISNNEAIVSTFRSHFLKINSAVCWKRNFSLSFLDRRKHHHFELKSLKCSLSQENYTIIFIAALSSHIRQFTSIYHRIHIPIQDSRNDVSDLINDETVCLIQWQSRNYSTNNRFFLLTHAVSLNQCSVKVKYFHRNTP